MKSLSPRQTDALTVIICYINEHGYPPTLREIAEAMGLTGLNGMHDHISRLEHKGYIDRTDKGSRAIKVLRFCDGRPAVVSVHSPPEAEQAEEAP